MAKQVPVTSVTPASKVKAVSKAQQARTRKLVGAIASVTPVGRVARSAATAAKAIKAEATMAKAGWNTAAKANYRAQVKREANPGMPTKANAGMATAQGAKQLYQLRATASADKTAQIAKNSVKTKPARKPVGNPPNDMKAIESQISSISRGGVGRSLGKARDTRVANSKKPTAGTPVKSVREPARTPKSDRSPFTYDTVRINSGVKSKSADQARSNATKKSSKLVKPVAAKVPARKPTPNPANPPRGTVRINSGSKRPAVLRKSAAALKKK